MPGMEAQATDQRASWPRAADRLRSPPGLHDYHQSSHLVPATVNSSIRCETWGKVVLKRSFGADIARVRRLRSTAFIPLPDVQWSRGWFAFGVSLFALCVCVCVSPVACVDCCEYGMVVGMSCANEHC